MSAETFKSLCKVIDALPDRLPAETPLRDAMPGTWPTVGDLRRLILEIDQRKR